MRIGIDAKWYFTGPVSTRVILQNLLPQLFNLHPDHQWFIFLDKRDQYRVFPFKQANVHPVYLRVPTNMLSNIFIVPPHASRLKLDAVVFQTFPGIAKGFSSISFIHDILFKRFPQYFTWKERMYFIPLPFFTRRADRVIATTEFVRKELFTYRFIQSPSQLDIVPLGVSAEFKPLEQQDHRIAKKISAKYNLPADFILFVGRLNARKNIESLIKAIPLLHDQTMPLVIAGKEDWKKPDFRKLIEDQDIRKRVYLIGSVGDDEIATLFAMAKIFCFPSFAEGFGLPPLEAMASGVPVVVSNTTSLPEICGDAAVYADPRLPENIAGGINKLLEDKVFYNKMRDDGLRRAAGFTWIAAADRLMESITDTAKKKTAMNTGCPICQNKDYKIVYEMVFNCPYAGIVQCENCGHIYSLITKDVDTNALYEDEVYRVVENRGSLFDRILNLEYTRVIKKINSLLPRKGSLLDFGCGKGKFGWLAAKDHWKVKCVETSSNRAEYARMVYHLDVNTAFYETGKIFETPFDAITLFHVLEHLPRPMELTAALTRDNLKREGLLIIEVPNINSWQSAFAKEKWIHLDVPRHINHFTKKRLGQMMDKIGFAPVRVAGFSFHLGVLGMLDSLLKLCGYRKNIIFELKNRKSAGLLLRIAFFLPVAVLLECFAACCGQGGITRMYLKYK